MATEHEDGSVTIELEDEQQEQQEQKEVQQKETKKEEQEEGARASEGEEAEDDEDDDDSEGSEEASGDDHSSRTELNRRRRQQKKQLRREREDSLRRELDAANAVIHQMQERINVVERRSTGTEMVHLDNELRTASEAYNYFKDQVKLAVDANNGQLAVEATEKMNAAQRRAEDLTRIKQAYQKQQTAPPPLDPRLLNHAQSWLSRNQWYRPDLGDTDSRVAKQVDDALAAEGWNPTTPEYWKELDSRLKKYLPNRYSAGYNNNRQVRNVVPGGTQEGAPAQKSSSNFTVSAERVNALKDAGLWDDPKKRADAIRRFREYDKQTGQR